MKKTHMKLATIVLALLLIVSTLCSNVFAATAPQNKQPIFYEISNPYANVDWATYGQYKADFHAHSTNSDGSNLMKDMVEDHYGKEYDILAMTDHNYLTESWDRGNNGTTSERRDEIQSGVGRDGKPMIDITQGNEQSVVDHINTFFAPFNNGNGSTMITTLAQAEELGGISHINHPGRYTGGANNNDATSIAASNNPVAVNKYVDLFMTYSSCVGMEIINKIDNESKSDRILWDNILKQTMPQGRSVWGFANDDTHSLNATGYAWNVMLMPELNQAETRNAMENGAFYAVSRVSRLDGINRYYPEGGEIRGDGAAATLYLLEQSTPSISNIVVIGNTITITGADCDFIEWIADGVVIATGASIDLSDYSDNIGSYVRAQLKSATGIAFTQPFGFKESNIVNVVPSASVEKLNGNQNNLTITVTEYYSNGMANIISETVKINNNAADTYTVGKYKVYVDTKGNDQVRACYIVG